MLEGELRSGVLAIAAAILVPVLTRLLSRSFPPEEEPDGDADVAPHKVRNQIIEYAGVVFFLAGSAVPFVLQGTGRLEPTAGNITLIFSFALLFMVGGIAALAALCGDRNAESFLAYFEHERRVNRSVLRIAARMISTVSVLALVTVLCFISS